MGSPVKTGPVPEKRSKTTGSWSFAVFPYLKDKIVRTAGDCCLRDNKKDLPKISIVKLHVAVRSETGDLTRKVMAFSPTGSSPPNCLAHRGSDSTYLDWDHNKNQIRKLYFFLFITKKYSKIPEPIHIRFGLRERDVSSFFLRRKGYSHIARALNKWNWTVCCINKSIQKLSIQP